MPEVHKHGFTWEKDLITNVYGCSQEQLKQIKYTSKMDLPAALNRLGHYDLSIKTSCSANAVCMADALRIFDAAASGKPFHMTVVHYKQVDDSKVLQSITEVDLTNATHLLFGSLTRADVEEVANLVKAVPQKRSPTAEEHAAIYAVRDKHQAQSGAIHLDIKCNSQQSRLQCSFNHFQEFLATNPSRVVARSTTNSFRGSTITESVVSGRRTFRTKQIASS
jgi:hypothetical protein